MALAAVDADDRVEQLLALTERLTAMLGRETRAFESRKPHEAAETIEETGRLANLYRHESARIRREPALVAGASPAARVRLMDATVGFEAVLARHERALSAAKTVTEGLVRAVAEEVASTRNPAAGYGPGARMGGADARSTAITLNRTA